MSETKLRVAQSEPGDTIRLHISERSAHRLVLLSGEVRATAMAADAAEMHARSLASHAQSLQERLREALTHILDTAGHDLPSSFTMEVSEGHVLVVTHQQDPAAQGAQAAINGKAHRKPERRPQPPTTAERLPAELGEPALMPVSDNGTG